MNQLLTALLLVSYLLTCGCSRLSNSYGPPRPQSFYATPSKLVPSHFKPPQTSYKTPAKPKLPPIRPQTSYKSPFKPSPPKPAPSKPLPTYKPSSSNVAPSQKFPPGMPYSFQWGVEDNASGNSYNHVESSDGKKTEGRYQVLLPDGRVQIVKFFDIGDGFIAEVTYE